ncbi:MAG: hypothetical protein ACFCU7_12055 [Pleurocapsa sp.]
MNISELVDNLTQQGVKLWVNDDKLGIRSPKGVLTPQLKLELNTHKTKIVDYLQEPKRDCATSQGISVATIGLLISGFDQNRTGFRSPIVDPQMMAQKLTVTFRPLPKGYRNGTIAKFRSELKDKLEQYGVTVKTWQQATKDFYYQIDLPWLNWKPTIKTRVVKGQIHAVIDVDRPASLVTKAKKAIAESIYQLYSYFVARGKKMSIAKIALLIGWAEESVAKYIENPTTTQAIVLTDLDRDFINPQISYQEKIDIGINTLIRTFSEIVIGVSDRQISILNMNLSDSLFAKKEFDKFVGKSLIPKIFVPIAPLLMSRFEVGKYQPAKSDCAVKLVELGHSLADTGLFPPGFKLSKAIARKSYRDIVDVIVNGRTGVSYGFVAYIEPPQYIGDRQISETEWSKLLPVEGFNSDEVRQNHLGRRYLKTQALYQQIPDIWLVSSRSGSNKTNLNLETDIVRIGLTNKNKLLLQLPQGVDLAKTDLKPSYDIYVMLAIALSTALYTPELVSNGAPLVHFHGYPSVDWFRENEYYSGVEHPSVPCGTYESGVFNYLGISKISDRADQKISLASLIEPDHGTNIIASDMNYLIERLKAGCQQKQIELGGKYFSSLEKNAYKRKGN